MVRESGCAINEMWKKSRFRKGGRSRTTTHDHRHPHSFAGSPHTPGVVMFLGKEIPLDLWNQAACDEPAWTSANMVGAIGLTLRVSTLACAFRAKGLPFLA